MNAELSASAILADLIRVDGEIGSPKLRHRCDQLQVVLDRASNLLILLVLRGTEHEVLQQLHCLASPVETILAESLEELEHLLESSRIEAAVDAFVLLPDIQQCQDPSLMAALPNGATLFSADLGEFPKEYVGETEPLTEDEYDRLSILLFPKRQWKRVHLVRDEDRLTRIEQRVELNRELLNTAWGFSAASTVIQGGPGSGKSLLLVSRAQWLATALPEGNILLLTWNRTLADALRQWCLKLNTAPVTVSTLAEFFALQGLELDLSVPADADCRSRQILESRRFTPSYDAILVDEAQDLGGSLLKLVCCFVRSNSGGLAASIDRSQNLRGRPPIDYASLPKPIEQVSLNRCYRSTDAIRLFSFAFAGYDMPDAGPVDVSTEKVRFVWAESPPHSSAMIVFEAGRLIRDVGLREDEILIVVFDGQQRRGLGKALQEAGYRVSRPGADGEDSGGIRLASPEVAKGHEASCVFVVGWDTEDVATDVSSSRRFVAASRAADILYVLYTSQEHGRLSAEADELTVKQIWPDDFEVAQED